ncbi:MAG: class B sortase [Clostridia bacterium]|nr:class B sortase [Clostridia bacterium]
MRTGSRACRRRPLWPALLLTALALGCAAGAGQKLRSAARAEENIAALRETGAAEIVYVRLAGASEESGAPAAAEGAGAARVRALQAENGELAGWLTMEAAGVDYPVMYSPARPNYYIDHDFSGERSAAGLPYIDEDCDTEKGVNRIIYGHNMRNGTMFGNLERYLDKDFFQANRVFYFDTAEGREAYRVIAAYETPVDGSEACRFYDYTAIETEADYRAYVEGSMALGGMPGDEAPLWGERLLTLVTCVSHQKDWRLVLLGAEIAA